MTVNYLEFPENKKRNAKKREDNLSLKKDVSDQVETMDLEETDKDTLIKILDKMLERLVK